MLILNILQALFALAVTLGLVLAAAWAVRRWAPAGLITVRPRSERRLELVETLVIDAQHRLVLVRTDGEERLILVGEGVFADPVPKSPR